MAQVFIISNQNRIFFGKWDGVMQPTCQIGERLRLEPANFFTDGYGLVRSAAGINTAGRDLRFPVPDANCCAAGLAGETKNLSPGSPFTANGK